MEREVEASLSVINNPWGDGTSVKCLAETWERTKLFKRAEASDVQPIVSAINTKLGSQTERLNALKLLLQVSKECSDGVLSEHGATFVQQSARFCEKHNNATIRSTALLIIKHLACRAEKFPNMVKSVTGSALSQVVDCLSDTTLKIHACYALASIFTYFSGSCGSIKANVEQRLIEILIQNNEKAAIAGSGCFARLALAGGGGTAQQGHQAAFVLLQKRTIGSLHLELDAIYEGIHELPVSLPCNKNENLNIPTVTEVKPTVKLQKLERRIKFLSHYLNALLLEPMSMQKGILVHDLLGLVCRALGVTGSSLGNSQLMEMQVLRDLIPSVHISFLTILESLISICGTNLLIHQETFFQIIKNSLAWTFGKIDSKSSKSFLRRRIYECLGSWIMEMKGASGVESYSDSIIPQILQDVSPEKEAVVLKAVKQPTKRKKGKTPDKSSSIPLSAGPANIFDGHLCSSALSVLDTLIRSAGNLIKPSHHKTIQEHVIGVLVELQRGFEAHPLYESEKCQLQLYEILQTLILFCHPSCPPPTVYAVTLFSTGQMAKAPEVARFCQQAVQVVQRVSFPIYPSVVLETEYGKSREDENGYEMEASPGPEPEADESEEENFVVSDEVENDKQDSDLEVIEEILVQTEVDEASADEEELNDEKSEEEETIRESSEEEEERIPEQTKNSDEEEVELISEHPPKKARVEAEVISHISPKNLDEDVVSMIADFVD